MSGDPFYITTPIYYVNGTPHIGHAYTTIAADTATRYHRMLGRPARFVTGTDEHGQKVLEAAEARGLSPKAHVDDLVPSWKAMMEGIDISYDRFIRTTDSDHEAVVTRVLQRLFDEGLIYQDVYEGWYVVTDEAFITDKDREAQIKSGKKTEADFKKVEETNYFFKMSQFQQPLIEHIEANPTFLQPASRRNEVLGFLRNDLGDLCISRPKARMRWGIELPFDTDYVCYVWFDALLNYLTAAGYTAEKGDRSHDAWWPAVHLIGKDILTTHSVYWTTMLLALDVPLPKQIYAHGWWLSNEDEKISKSKGNTIDVDRLCESFGVDPTRFFFLCEIRFGADGTFSYDGFLTTYNTTLANDLGNLIHRGLSMTSKWLGPTVPARNAPDSGLLTLATDAAKRAHEAFETLQFKDAIDAVFEVVGAANKHIEDQKPWDKNKAGETEALAAVMRDVLEVCAFAGLWLLPVMPTKAAEVLRAVGLSPDEAETKLRALVQGESQLDVLTEGQPLAPGDPIFPRHVEMPPLIAELLAPEEEDEGDIELPDLDWIEFPDFAKIQLRVGHVLEAGLHPDADKLLVLKVDIGERRPRTICAGIKAVFQPEQLVGRKVVVVANLKPRKMRGIVSEGMILAAGDKQVVDLVSVEAHPGETVR
ncbi:MAG: methionine--tRNA ligase [Myxococcota bacterium]